MPRELRVTIEVLRADGTTANSAVVLIEEADVRGELEPGSLGDIDTAIDELLSEGA